MKKFIISLEDDLHEALKIESAKYRITMNRYANEILVGYFKVTSKLAAEVAEQLQHRLERRREPVVQKPEVWNVDEEPNPDSPDEAPRTPWPGVDDVPDTHGDMDEETQAPVDEDQSDPTPMGPPKFEERKK